MTLFTEVHWRDLPESQNIEVSGFLKDAESLIRLVDLLGSQMKPVRSDMQGNITKISDSQKKHCPDKQFIHEVLEHEIELGINKKDPSASVGLLWLKRGMEYFYVFLSILVEEYKNENDSIADYAKRAYEQTLKVHHSWFMNKTFTMVSHLSPKKSTVVKNITNDKPELIADLDKEVERYLATMKPYIDTINVLITKYELAK